MKLEGVHSPAPGRAVRVQVDGVPVAIFNVDGQLFGVDARCTHVGGPLDQGRLDGTVVTCPLHGSRFDVQTGAVVHGPAMRPVRRYVVQVDGNGLSIDPA